MTSEKKSNLLNFSLSQVKQHGDNAFLQNKEIMNQNILDHSVQEICPLSQSQSSIQLNEPSSSNISNSQLESNGNDQSQRSKKSKKKKFQKLPSHLEKEIYSGMLSNPLKETHKEWPQEELQDEQSQSLLQSYQQQIEEVNCQTEINKDAKENKDLIDQVFQNVKNKNISNLLSFDMGDEFSSIQYGINKCINESEANLEDIIDKDDLFDQMDDQESYIGANCEDHQTSLDSSAQTSYKNHQISQHSFTTAPSYENYMKTTIVDHYFNGEEPFVQEDLNETVKKVFEYTESLSKDKITQIDFFEKKLKNFIFDYRYDSHMRPRKYTSLVKTDRDLRQKYKDAIFDERKIKYEIVRPEHNPFCLYCNEVDVYIKILTNEPCIKTDCYKELEEYFRGVFYEDCDILANYLTEKSIYNQHISLYFRENRITFKIRVQPKESKLFSSRDLIIKTFYEKNPRELNVFASFVLYWAQKRKLMSSDCIDKNAWIILIYHYFQINKRLPPSINYDILKLRGKKLEDECYRNERIDQSMNHEQTPKQNHYQQLAFNFDKFNDRNNKSEFVMVLRSRNSNLKQNVNQNQYFNRPYTILPLIFPSCSALHKVNEIPLFNFGGFFYKFIYYLHHQLVSNPLAISISNQLIWKRSKQIERREVREPIAILDFLYPEINLVDNITYSPDALSHIMDQLKHVIDSIQSKKNPKVFLSDLPQPFFKKQKIKTNKIK